ncbi:MAG: hypothetical protein OXE81_10945 [Gammaproteobacteria bacterium]|nr:hypothetical protein [Gammaproteobacteria bacterium]
MNNGRSTEDISTSLDLLRQYLKAGPENDRAQALRDELRLGLLEATRKEIEAENLDKARKLLDMAATEWPRDDAFMELRDQRRQLVEQLAATAELERLIDLGEVRLASDDLTMPAGDSAADYFRQVLTMDPRNAIATAGLLRIAERYVTLIRDAIDQRETNRAQQLHARLAYVAPQHPAVISLRARIEAAEEADTVDAAQAVAKTTVVGQNTNLTATEQNDFALRDGPAIANDQEGQLWSEVMNHCDETQIRRYIDAYPAGRYVEEAWRRLSSCLEEAR